jgi:DinB superfamily
MNTIEKLILDVSIARKKYIDQIECCTQEQAQWKPAPEVWNMVEITEHLFWAEQGGILGMWKSIDAIREGKMERKFESIHQDMPIEQIIELTWQPNEKVPPAAAPRLGGPLSFWCNSLNTLQEVLESFGRHLKNDELRLQAHPHPISGSMDFQQRFEFLRFHTDRHRAQVFRLINGMNGKLL